MSEGKRLSRQIIKHAPFIFSHFKLFLFVFSNREMEEDPFFTDNEFSGPERLLSLSREERKSSTHTEIAETVNR